MSEEFDDKFGFTENEVETLLKDFIVLHLYDQVQGYLKQTGKRRDEIADKIFYTLSIPNMEVRFTYTRIIDRYFATELENEKVEIILKALIEGEVNLFEKMLRKIVLAVFSYHDFSGEPEKVYHALVAALLIWISNTHEIKSNRESGYGRYDIMIVPHDVTRIGNVIEFKTVDAEDNETVDTAAAAALAQIEEKKYEAELITRGIQNIKKLAMVFNNKDVYIKEKETGCS